MAELLIEYVEPTPELIQQIADDMRPEDAVEVWASHHHTPLQALQAGLEKSAESAVMLVEGQPCVAFGVVKTSLLSGSGVAWVLGTNAAMQYRKEFINQSQPILNVMLAVCPHLFNYVHAKNRRSIRWLKRIGFTVEDPKPMGPDGELFHYFHISKES